MTFYRNGVAKASKQAPNAPNATSYASVRPPTKGFFNLFKGLQSSVNDLAASPENILLSRNREF